MTKIIMGRLLDNTPAEIRVTDAEAEVFGRSTSYPSKLLILRRAGFRQRLVSMLLNADGRIEPNIGGREPGPNETLLWLAHGQFSEALDRRPKIELGPEAVALLGLRGSYPRPASPPDAELLAWLDTRAGTTAKDLAACMGVERLNAQRRLTAMHTAGLVRRSAPGNRHSPVLWYLAEAEEQAA